MTFVPTRNFYSAMRAQSGCTGQTIYETDGTTSHTFQNIATNSTANIVKGAMPYLFDGVASDYGNTIHKAVIEASSSSSISANTVATPDKIGTVTATFAVTSTGQTFNITVVGSGLEDETVRAFTFGKRVSYGSGYYACLLVYSIILDTPVVLNAENNYTANFTFAMEF